MSDANPIDWGLELIDDTPTSNGNAQEIAEITEFLEKMLDGWGPLTAGQSIGWSPRKTNQMMVRPEIRELVEVVQDCKDESIERAFFRTGLSGNVTAQLAWLYNRKPHMWKDTKRVVVQRDEKISVEVIHSVKQSALELIREAGVRALQPGGAIDVTSHDA